MVTLLKFSTWSNLKDLLTLITLNMSVSFGEPFMGLDRLPAIGITNFISFLSNLVFKLVMLIRVPNTPFKVDKA